MKLIFLDLTTPLLAFKCGPAAIPLISAGVGAVGGIGGSLIQGDYSSSNVNKQLAAQKEENQINRDWQTSEAEKNRDFQSAQVLHQNQFAREMMGIQFGNQQQLAAQQQGYNLQSMAKQAEYNSPVYQAAELRKAHLNPQVYFGQSSSFSGSSGIAGGAPSAGAGSVPSAPSGSMPGSVGGLSPVGYQPPNLQIGQILKDFADARKSMAETKTEDLMRDPMYKEVMSRVKNQQLVNQWQEMANFVFQKTIPAKVQHAFIELSKAEKDVILADDQHKLNEAEKRYKEAQTALARSAEALNGSQAVLFGLKADNFYKDFESELAVRRSEVSKNVAQAAESTASADQTKLFNKLYSDKRYQHALVTEALEKGRQAVEQTKISKSQAEHMTYLVEQAAYANDMKEFTYWSGQVNQFVNTLGQAASQFYGAGALRELIKLRQQGKSSTLESGKGYYMDNDGLLFKRP